MLTHLPGSPPLGSSSDQSGESVESLDINRIIGELIIKECTTKPRSKSLYARVKQSTKRRRRAPPKTDNEEERRDCDNDQWPPPDCRRKSRLKRSLSNPIVLYNSTNL